MRVVVAALVNWFPLDDRGRRVFDETLLDWETEAARPGSTWRRIAREIRAVGSVCRAFVWMMASDLARVPYGWFVPRLMLFTFALSLPFSYPIWRVARERHSLELGALMLPPLVQLMIPIAVFLALVWPPHSRRVPAVGFALLAMLGTVALGGWGIPLANQRFMQIAWQSVPGHQTSARPTGGLTESTLPDLVRRSIPTESYSARLRLGGDARRAQSLLLRMTGSGCLAGTMVLLAATVVRWGLWRKRRWLLLALPVYVLALAGAFGLSNLLFGPSVGSLSMSLGLWILALFVCGAISLLNWRPTGTALRT